MRDVSKILDHYRESARSLWNHGFWEDVDLQNWDAVEQFDELQRNLFTELVLGKLGREWPRDDIFRLPIPFLKVVPSIQSAPIMIQNPRPDRPSGYWDHPLNRLSPGDAQLQFLKYFDWNRLDYVDFRYYQVKIESFGANAELPGREALIERQHAVVYLVD